MTHPKPTALRKLAFRIAERLVEECFDDSEDTEEVAAVIYQELPFDLEEEARIDQELREKLDCLDDETSTALPTESPFAKLRAAVFATSEMKIMTVIDAAVKTITELRDAQQWRLGMWTCGCGTVNGVNLATCRVCGRKEGDVS